MHKIFSLSYINTFSDTLTSSLFEAQEKKHKNMFSFSKKPSLLFWLGRKKQHFCVLSDESCEIMIILTNFLSLKVMPQLMLWIANKICGGNSHNNILNHWLSVAQEARPLWLNFEAFSSSLLKQEEAKC
jgi:hypothetical protein